MRTDGPGFIHSYIIQLVGFRQLWSPLVRDVLMQAYTLRSVKKPTGSGLTRLKKKPNTFHSCDLAGDLSVDVGETQSLVISSMRGD